MMPILCACGCGTPLRVAKYPSQQSTWVRGHAPSSKLDETEIAKRFWSKVDKRESCWIWTGEKSAHFGYGRLHVKKTRVRAHRYSWQLHKGPVPRGMFVLHSCDNPLCVNPGHLRLGTQPENIQDQIDRGRHSGQQRRAS